MRVSHHYIITHFGLLTLTVAFLGCTPEEELINTTPDLNGHARQLNNHGQRLPNPAADSIGSGETPADTETGSGAEDSKEESTAAVVLALLGNAPNPFNPATNLSFTVPEGGSVTLAIYGVDGRQARQLLVANLPAGEHTITWHGRDDAGRRLPSGVYFARLRRGSEIRIRKLAIVQ